MSARIKPKPLFGLAEICTLTSVVMFAFSGAGQKGPDIFTNHTWHWVQRFGGTSRRDRPAREPTLAPTLASLGPPSHNSHKLVTMAGGKGSWTYLLGSLRPVVFS